jgi:lipopolysaccharide transport system ATP-binding protein
MQDLGKEIRGKRHGGNGELRRDEFWAVKDVSFELKRGECLGLIGRNGAGKTTLLRLLNGLIKPDQGRVEMWGRVGAIIALGAGFNPILTGRENIYVNASVLGLSKREIDTQIDEIIDFAEIGEFIDMPVQSYSSGMSVRLGFAIATVLKPDILLLDEVLAVGDAAFRFKCHRRINEVLKDAAVIFVSHDMPHIARICDKTLVLTHGEVHFFGATQAGMEVYRSLNENGVSAEEGFISINPPITHFVVEPQSKEIPSGTALIVDMVLTASRFFGSVTLRVAVYTLSGAFAADALVDSDEHRMKVDQGTNRWRIQIASLPLKAGRYQVSFSFADSDGEFLAVSYKCHEIIITGGHLGTVADCQLAIGSWTTT